MSSDILNALVLLANFVIVPGIAYGCQLALGALGVTIIYAILRFSNFGHGELMSFATVLTIFVTWMLQGAGIGLGILPTALLALPFAIIGAILLALFTDKIVYRYYRRQKASPIIFLITSIGVMFTMAGLIRFLIGPDDQIFMDGERFIINAREFKELSGLNEGLAIKTTQVVTLICTIIAATTLFWFLQYSKTGKMMRAYSDNEDLALLSGINPDQIVRYAWIIAAVLATLAGVLYGLDKSYKPFVYQQLLLPIFAAAIVGGIGSPVGAVLGGFVVSFSEILLTYPYKKFLSYLLPADYMPGGLVQFLSTDYKFAISFLMLVIILVVRPTGLMRGQSL